MNIEQRNEAARLKLNAIFKKKKDIAKELNMYPSDFSNFLAGRKPVGPKTLIIIEQYLNDISRT